MDISLCELPHSGGVPNNWARGAFGNNHRIPKAQPGKRHGAPAGNQFWKKRRAHGRRLAFASPEQLQRACWRYFDWVDANPLTEEKVFQYQGSIVRGELRKMRAMTLGGLCRFLGITGETWRAYRRRKGFLGVCEWTEEVIWVQKFTGAAAGLLNPAIIARDLALRDPLDVDAKAHHRAAEMGDDELTRIARGGESGWP